VNVQVFCGKIPKDMYEDELIPLFEKWGRIWDLRLMMDPMSGLNRSVFTICANQFEKFLKTVNNHVVFFERIIELKYPVKGIVSDTV
jgi:hypothetical protein